MKPGQEYIKVEITRQTVAANNEYPRAQQLLTQELDPEQFTLSLVVQAINFPSQFELLRRLAASPTSPEVQERDPEVQRLCLADAEDRVLEELDRRYVNHEDNQEAANAIIHAIFDVATGRVRIGG